VGQFETAELRGVLKIEVCAVETATSRHGAANLAALGEIIHIVSDDYVGIKRVSALLAVAIGIV
jgi:hypothetical protein